MSALPASAPCWITWREDKDPKTGKPRKTPYDFVSGARLNAYAKRDFWTLRKLPPNALPGFVLGAIDDTTAIIGLDLDTCRDAAGKLTDWACDALDVFDSYAEVSPSGTGVKAYARIKRQDLTLLREMLGGNV